MILALLFACAPQSEATHFPLPAPEEVEPPTPLAELFLTISDFKEDCEQDLLALEIEVGNAGDVDVAAGLNVHVYAMPDHVVVASGLTPAGLVGGGAHTSLTLEVPISAIGASGLVVEVDAIGSVEEYGWLPNLAEWDHDCCPEEPPASLGEIWGVASANNGDYSGLEGPHAPYGSRPGGVIWRLNLDTQQPEIVRSFDPVLDDIWYLGGLALHPTEPIVYVTAFKYEATGAYVANEWLDGWDTLLAIDTDTYQILGEWDMAPEPYSFTGLASDFVDGQDDLYSPGGIQFIDGELYAVEGMTVHHSDLIHIDMSSGTPDLTDGTQPAYAIDHWGGGVQTNNAGQRFATCNEVPAENLDINGNEIAWVPENAMLIAFDMAAENDCSDPILTFELDRVHGITLDGNDTLYAARSTRTHWYDEADAPNFVDADLQLYTVADDGSMSPYFDLGPILDTAGAPIDGIANIDWRSL